MFNFYVSPPQPLWVALLPLLTPIVAIAAILFNEFSKRRSEREAVRVSVSRAKHEQRRQALFKVIPCIRRAMRLANTACQKSYDAREMQKVANGEDVFGYRSDLSEEEIEQLKERVKLVKAEAFQLALRMEAEADQAIASAVEYGEYPVGSNKSDEWLKVQVEAWRSRLRWQSFSDTMDEPVINDHLSGQLEQNLMLLVGHENRVLDALGQKDEFDVKSEALTLQHLDDRKKILSDEPEQNNVEETNPRQNLSVTNAVDNTDDTGQTVET